ncbi:MAG: hypothetical protein L6R39_001146 [Caloplaca ligustica]|nr:MAG: hypothetical protein L6R39_001146 [Caloplaca ligustica]
MAPSSVAPTSSLSTIPPEIRERIYHELCNDQPSSLFNLLTVSHCISREVRPWIFRQPITFNGQHNLFQWLSTVDPHFLHYVKTVRFELHDIDAKNIVSSFEERLRRVSLQGHSKGIDNPYFEACDRDCSQVLVALKKFRNLRDLTILDCTPPNPGPLLVTLRKLLHVILAELPLVTLSVPHGMLFVNTNTNNQIERLQIRGFAFVDPPRLPSYLNAFPKLRVLQMCSCWNNKGLHWHPGRGSISFHERSMPRLQELTICLHEINERSAREVVIYQNVERYIAHLATPATTSSLKTFRFWCYNWVGRNTSPLQTLMHYLQSSRLEHVDTSYWWSPLPHEYPRSIITISVRFDTNYRFLPNWLQKFYKVIQPPQKTRFFANRPHLREIRLYMPSTARDELWDVETRQAVVTRICRDRGVRLRVMYKTFPCDHGTLSD